MPSPSVTNTFSNSTTADATQVNQNFTDLINAMTDGTKDFSIAALTCAGNATFNGNTTIGNSSADTLTITASLASTIALQANNTYAIGAAGVGVSAVFFGASGGFTTRISAAATSTWTLTLPVDGGTSGYLLQTNGSGTTSWTQNPTSSHDFINLGVACSVGSSALTVALKQANGSSDPTSAAPVKVGFRSATSADGNYSVVSVTSSLSVTVSSGSTLGTSSSNGSYLYVYLINNSGTAELAVSSKRFDDGAVVSTTAEGGAGAADSWSTMYSTTARSNVPCRLIARLRQSQTTAGTWASVPSVVSLAPFDETSIVTGAINPWRAEWVAVSFPAGVPTVDAQSMPGLVTSISDDGTGLFTLTLFTGLFSSAPYGLGTCQAATDRTVTCVPGSATSIQFRVANLAGSGTDTAVFCQIIGPRA